MLSAASNARTANFSVLLSYDSRELLSVRLKSVPFRQAHS